MEIARMVMAATTPAGSKTRKRSAIRQLGEAVANKSAGCGLARAASSTRPAWQVMR